MRIEDEIKKLKQDKRAIILSHYYQMEDIQDVADFVGDSYALSKKARDNDAQIIVFCGVKFMAESAKILSPDKKVLLPVMDAGCPMADMVTAEDIAELRQKYPNAAVVTYINSNTDVKASSDVCVTSSNAVKVVRSLKEKQVVFVPDQNLANYVASQVPEKEIITFHGFCVVHHRLTQKDVDDAKSAIPDALVLAHPECPAEVLAKADYVGSTAGIIEYARKSSNKRFIIGTEMGILHTLKNENPDKQFFLLAPKLLCTNMKKTKIADVLDALKLEQHEITLSDEIIEKARRSLDRMLEV